MKNFLSRIFRSRTYRRWVGSWAYNGGKYDLSVRQGRLLFHELVPRTNNEVEMEMTRDREGRAPKGHEWMYGTYSGGELALRYDSSIDCMISRTKRKGESHWCEVSIGKRVKDNQNQDENDDCPGDQSDEEPAPPSPVATSAWEGEWIHKDGIARIKLVAGQYRIYRDGQCAPLRPVGEGWMGAEMDHKGKDKMEVRVRYVPAGSVSLEAMQVEAKKPGYKPSQMVNATPDPNTTAGEGTPEWSFDEAEPSFFIGKTISVSWPKMSKWYDAKVVKYDAGSGKHHLVYDDGDERDTRLSERSFSIKGMRGRHDMSTAWATQEVARRFLASSDGKMASRERREGKEAARDAKPWYDGVAGPQDLVGKELRVLDPASGSTTWNVYRVVRYDPVSGRHDLISLEQTRAVQQIGLTIQEAKVLQKDLFECSFSMRGRSGVHNRVMLPVEWNPKGVTEKDIPFSIFPFHKPANTDAKRHRRPSQDTNKGPKPWTFATDPKVRNAIQALASRVHPGKRLSMSIEALSLASQICETLVEQFWKVYCQVVTHVTKISEQKPGDRKVTGAAGPTSEPTGSPKSLVALIPWHLNQSLRIFSNALVPGMRHAVGRAIEAVRMKRSMTRGKFTLADQPSTITIPLTAVHKTIEGLWLLRSVQAKSAVLAARARPTPEFVGAAAAILEYVMGVLLDKGGTAAILRVNKSDDGASPVLKWGDLMSELRSQKELDDFLAINHN